MLAGIANRVMLAAGWRRRSIAFVAGGLSALAMAPVDAWPILTVTFPVLVWLIDGAGAGRQGLRATFAAGWWFGFGYFFFGLYWIGMALLVEADRFAWALPLAVVAIPMGLALFTGFGAALARLLWSPGAGRILALAAGLTAAEWLRGHALSGFPWNTFGYAIAAVPALAQTASLIGLWGLTLIAIAAFSTPAILADGPETTPWPWFPPALAMLALLAMAAYGGYRLATTETGTVDGVRLRIMQPNVPQDQKFRPSAKQAVMDRYRSLSDRATGPETRGVRDVTHLIWPESAFPFFLEREPDALARIADLLPPGVTLITGAARLEPPTGSASTPRVYNSIRVIGDDGAIVATYDKVHLVPFGEYLPLQSLLEAIGLEPLTRVHGGFAAGARLHSLAVPGLPAAAPLICYEAIFPGAVVPADSRPGFLLNVTNDAWFGITPGPYQHFAQARLRTIEEGLPLVRAANNGISAIVDPLGRVMRVLPLGRDGLIDGPLPKAIAPPAYARYGDGPTLLFICLSAVAAWVARRRRHLDEALSLQPYSRSARAPQPFPRTLSPMPRRK
jgi:apolipoprotein N-acyltransferase